MEGFCRWNPFEEELALVNHLHDFFGQVRHQCDLVFIGELFDELEQSGRESLNLFQIAKESEDFFRRVSRDMSIGSVANACDCGSQRSSSTWNRGTIS